MFTLAHYVLDYDEAMARRSKGTTEMNQGLRKAILLSDSDSEKVGSRNLFLGTTSM